MDNIRLAAKIAFIIIFSIQVACKAQFDDTTHYLVGLTATGTINKTNGTETYLANQGGRFAVRKERVTLNLAGSWVYGQQQEKVTNNDINTTFNCDLKTKFPRAYFWGLATYTSSYSLKILNQYQAGAGIAYDLIDKKQVTLNLSDGILYEESDVYLKDTLRDKYNTFRNSFRLTVRLNLKDDIVKFYSMSFMQNSLSLSADYIFRTTNSLDVKLYKWLMLSCAYTYNKFNRTGKENTLFTYGLKLEHYF